MCVLLITRLLQLVERLGSNKLSSWAKQQLIIFIRSTIVVQLKFGSVFCGVTVLFFTFLFGVEAFVIGLSQNSSRHISSIAILTLDWTYVRVTSTCIHKGVFGNCVLSFCILEIFGNIDKVGNIYEWSYLSKLVICYVWSQFVFMKRYRFNSHILSQKTHCVYMVDKTLVLFCQGIALSFTLMSVSAN